MKINVTKYIGADKFNCKNYLLKKAADAAVDTSNIGNGAKFLVNANNWQGEHFNNFITAIGTAGVAPIFIINNPLAKEDMNTKKYTAARQPISAVITLAAQVPIMSAYNKMLDNYVTEHRLDRCDLHAAPPKSYFNKLISAQTKKFLLENPDFAGQVKKSQIKDLFYEKAKNNSFYEELSKIRKIIHGIPFAGEENYQKVAELLKNSVENNKFKIDTLLSPKDFENAEKHLLHGYLNDTHSLVFKDGKLVKVGENEITKNHHKIEIKSVSDLKKASVRSLLKKYGLEIGKDELSAIKEAFNDDIIRDQAIKTVEAENLSKAKAKFQMANMATKAQAKLLAYKSVLLKENLSEAQIADALKKRSLKLLEEMLEDAQNIKSGLKQGVVELTTEEAEYLCKKISDKIDNKYNPAMKPNKTFLDKAKIKIYNCFEGERNINLLKVEGRATLEETLLDQQAKKWLTTRINNSQKILKNFKNISGLIVGLAILPFTCGLLNWAYPRFMEEFFPKLANSKAQSQKAKEVK